MSLVKISGNASGTGVFTIASPSSSTDRTQTLPDATGTVVLDTATQTLTNKTIQGGAIASGTAQASTSGTAIDFTGIPSWVKRITVNLFGVSTNGTTAVLVQLGAGSITSSGYGSSGGYSGGTSAGSTRTNGILIDGNAATNIRYATVTITNVSGNNWLMTVAGGTSDSAVFFGAGAGVTLAGTLDRVRITTGNGTDTFDAGSINILYE